MKEGVGRNEGIRTGGVKTKEKERVEGSTGAIMKGRNLTYRLAEGPIDGWIFFQFHCVRFFFFSLPDAYRITHWSKTKIGASNTDALIYFTYTYTECTGIFYIFQPSNFCKVSSSDVACGLVHRNAITEFNHVSVNVHFGEVVFYSKGREGD